MSPVVDFIAGRDWNGIANDVVAGFILIAIPAAIGCAVAIARGWKRPARWFADRAVARLPEAARDSVREELHAELDHGSSRAAFKFAFGIWLHVGDVQAAVRAEVSVGRRTQRYSTSLANEERLRFIVNVAFRLSTIASVMALLSMVSKFTGKPLQVAFIVFGAVLCLLMARRWNLP